MLTALTCARRHGVRTVLDIDYRPVLWGLTSLGDGETRFIAAEQVTRQLQAVLHLFDVIVGTEEEFHIAGGATDTVQALAQVREVSAATLVRKRGALGCSVYTDAIPPSLDDGLTVTGVRVEVLNVPARAMRLCRGCCAVISMMKAGSRPAATPTPAARWWFRATVARPRCRVRWSWMIDLSREHQVPRPDLDPTA